MNSEYGLTDDLEGCEVQAISAVEYAAMEVPRRRSPFRALVWKEWRQQRWIFLSLAGLAYVMLASAVIVVWPDRFKVVFENARNDGAAVLACCAAFLGVCSVVLLSANAFAGERDDNTDLFLETVPCSRSKLFWVKMGFVLLLVLLELIPVGTALLVCIGSQANVRLDEFAPGAGETLLALAAVVLVLAIIPAMIASFGGSVIATILASLPVCVGCFAYAFWSARLLLLFLVFKSYVGAISATALFVMLTFATIFIAAWRMWIRVERTWRSSLRTMAATAALLFAYVAVPAAVAYFYVTLFAPMSFFLAGNRVAGAWPTDISPNGKYMLFNSYYMGWGPNRGVRAAITNLDSGRTLFLTRFRCSALYRITNGIWSPSGNQFVLNEPDVWLWPLARESSKVAFFVVDARSGEKRSFNELCPGLPQMPPDSPVGWYGEQVFAFRYGRDISFADIEHHEVRRCKMPVAFANTSLNDWLPVTRRGIFAVAEDASAEKELHAFRYAPDLAEAESINLSGFSGTPFRLEASEDGQWLIVLPIRPAGHKESWCVAQSVDGAKATLLVSGNADDKSLLPPSWNVKRFLPGGHQILLYGEAELGLFDAASHNLRRIPIAQATGRKIVAVELSPTGGLALVRCDNPITSGKPGATFEVYYC